MLVSWFGCWFCPVFAYAALFPTWTWGSVTQKEIAGNIVVVLEYDHAISCPPRVSGTSSRCASAWLAPTSAGTRRFLHKRMITGQSELHPHRQDDQAHESRDRIPQESAARPASPHLKKGNITYV
jgi:hypothetical protein